MEAQFPCAHISRCEGQHTTTQNRHFASSANPRGLVLTVRPHDTNVSLLKYHSAPPRDLHMLSGRVLPGVRFKLDLIGVGVEAPHHILSRPIQVFAISIWGELDQEDLHSIAWPLIQGLIWGGCPSTSAQTVVGRLRRSARWISVVVFVTAQRFDALPVVIKPACRLRCTWRS